MKHLFLIILLGCASAPSPEKFTFEEVKNKECLAPLEGLRLSWPEKIQHAFLQTTGTAGSLLVTSAGVVSDTVVVSGGIATLFLCSYGNENGSLCGELIGPYFGIMEELDLLWTTKKAYKNTSTWRCPQVDHISRAYRKVSECLHRNGEYVSAYEQMSRVENDETVSECVSETEKLKWENLKAAMAR